MDAFDDGRTTHFDENEASGNERSITYAKADGNGVGTTSITPARVGRTFTHDAWNRLTESKANAPGLVLRDVDYAYDALGRMITHQSGSRTTGLYHSTAWQALTEVDTNAQSQVTEVRDDVWSLAYVDAMVFQEKRDAATTDGERTYPLHDANYNVTALLREVDTSGGGQGGTEWQVTSRYVYDPYGTPTKLTLGAEVNTSDADWHYLHQGGYQTDVDALYHFRRRSYDPSNGQWIQRDPAGYVDGLNLHEGLMSNPVSNLDPMGLDVSPTPLFFNDNHKVWVVPPLFQVHKELIGMEFQLINGKAYVVRDNLFSSMEELEAIIATQRKAGRHIPSSELGELRKWGVGQLESMRLGPKFGILRAPDTEPLPVATAMIHEAMRLQQLDRDSVGEPGLGESFVPVWGSGRSAVYAWQTERYGAAVFHTAMTISDVVALSSIWKMGVSFATNRFKKVGYVPAPPPGTPAWRFGEMAHANQLGYTDRFGKTVIREGLEHSVFRFTMRHEWVHRVLSPGLRPLLAYRAQFGTWGYHNFSMLKYTEEFLAQLVATGNPWKALKFPIQQRYTKLGDTILGFNAAGFVVRSYLRLRDWVTDDD